MFRFIRFVLGMVIAVWCAELSAPSKAFDVSAYYDPVSSVKIHSWNGGFNWGDCDANGVETLEEKAALLQMAHTYNDSVLRLYEEMGLTILNVFMEDSSEYFAQIAQHNIQIMNDWWYSPRFRYTEGQRRIMRVADSANKYILIADSLLSWGGPFTRTAEEVISENQAGDILSWPSMAEPDTVIAPATHFDYWMGWAKKAQIAPADCVWMPLKIKIKARLDTTLSSEDTLGYLTFFGRYWGMDGIASDSGATWVKFRPCTLWASKYSDTLNDYFVEDTIWIYPTTYAFYTNDTVSVNAWGSTWFPGDSITNRSTNESPYVHWAAHFDVGFEYRPMLISTGNVPFSLYSIEVMNGAYHQMFDAGDSVAIYEDIIANYFDSQHLARNGGNQVSWYFDEFDHEDIPSVARIADILSEKLGVKLLINGYGFNKYGRGGRLDFLRELRGEAAKGSVFMDEFYPFYGDSTCTPNFANPWDAATVYTHSSSDATYLDIEEADCGFPDSYEWEGSTIPFQEYNGTRSIQCALDASLWGVERLWADYGIPIPGGNDSVLQGGLATEAERYHTRGAKFWTLLQAGWQGLRNVDVTNNWGSSDRYEREITPNELKLITWLTVACDLDGVMFYPGMSNTYYVPEHVVDSTQGWRGLFDWITPTFCESGQGVRIATDRYYAAKEVCNEIHEIAPTLEALEFVKTYASRAFERNYGNSDHPATWRDTLGVRTSVFNPFDNSLYLDQIASFTPSGQGWSSTPESNGYVQVSRFMTPGAGANDYWFLVVNRRALDDERRRIRLGIELDSLDEQHDYSVDYVLQDSFAVCSTYSIHARPLSGREIWVDLAPGEAELIHFMPLDTSDLVLTDTVTLKAPYYYNRNIILDGAQVTIIPDTAIQRYTLIKGNDTLDAWKDSLEILFAPGKGIILAEPDSGSNKLTILGNDSTQVILKCSKGGDFRWAGIRTVDTTSSSSVTLKYATITRAEYGLFTTSRASIDSLIACRFIDNSIGVYSSGFRQVYCISNLFEKNIIGLQLQSGSILRGRSTAVLKSARHGILAVKGCTLDLDNITVSDGIGNAKKGAGGIRAVNSDSWLKCCKVENNEGIGVEIFGGSLLMANVDTSNDAFGDNWITRNTLEELVLASAPAFSLANGHNSIFDPDTTNRGFHYRGPWPWIVWEQNVVAPYSPSLTRNYWYGITDTTYLLSSFVKGLPFSFNPILNSQVGCNELPHDDTPTDLCLSGGVSAELVPNYLSAEISYQEALESSASSCSKIPAVMRLLSVHYLNGTSRDTTLSYLEAVLDTASDSETRHAVKLGISLTLIEGFCDPDSAKVIYQEVIDSAGSDIYRKIDGQAGMLMVEMREEESDTVDGLTVEELTTFLDSLDRILGQRLVWTQYEITDSVVMYAPTRVDSVINVRGDGVLTILPHPGYKNPVIEFVNQGAIKVWGTDTTKEKGKLYINGEPDSRITLHWGDSTGTKNIFSERGFVRMKHADFCGNGFVNQTQDFQGYINGLRRATFQADSCTFAWFDEGVMVRATDTTSYMRACTLSFLGGNAGLYSGLGAGLVMLRSDGFLVEGCVFDSNDGVGIYHGYSTDVVIRNCQIRNGAKAGVYGASSAGGTARLECCTIESNGDSLPELWTLGVIYDLVGSHCSFADSTGPLIKSSDPSYVDLENGENFLEIWDEGYYVQSGDTNDNWDITWNTWSPSTPSDGDFYDYLWPHTPSKWTVDSSLADFIACGTSGMSSMGSDNWLVIGPDAENAGTMSTGSDESQTSALALPSKTASKLPTEKSSGKAQVKQSTKFSKSTASLERKQSKMDLIAQHHRELEQWRSLREGKSNNIRQAAIQFVNENRNSEFVPAALQLIAGAASDRSLGQSSSKYLRDFGNSTRDQSLKNMAQRLSNHALALEGKPAEALQGCESMMDDASTPRDSVMALLDAMQIYCDFHRTGNLQAKHQQVVVTDPYDLVRRSLYLAERLDDPTLGVQEDSAPIPTSYALYQNYPNPFNPSTEIRFDLPEAIRVELKIFNILGQEVATLVDDVRAAGAFRVLWDGKNAAGLSVASGVYVYQIKTQNFTDAKKMVLIR